MSFKHASSKIHPCLSVSTNFRDPSMPTGPKNFVMSSFCDITFPARGNRPPCGIAEEEAEERGTEGVGRDNVY